MEFGNGKRGMKDGGEGKGEDERKEGNYGRDFVTYHMTDVYPIHTELK